VDSATLLEFTYILSEAAYTNTANLFLNTGGPGDDLLLLNNQTDTAGESVFASVSADVLDFTYCTNSGAGAPDSCISNFDGLSSDGLKIASTEIFQVDGRDTVFFLFGDGAGDTDVSDFVVRVQVAAVPLPAGGVLLLTALGGFAAMRSRKRRG
jgi:hypothetical protein